MEEARRRFSTDSEEMVLETPDWSFWAPAAAAEVDADINGEVTAEHVDVTIADRPTVEVLHSGIWIECEMCKKCTL